MGAAALGASIGVGALGSVLGGLGAKSADDARVQADKINAQLANQRAADALQLGAYQAGLARMRGSQVIGAQRAGYASSGIDENTGTAAQEQAQTRMMSELDAQMAQANARRESWGYQAQSKEAGLQAQVDKEAGDTSFAGSMLGGLGGAAKGIYGGFQNGIF